MDMETKLYRMYQEYCESLGLQALRGRPGSPRDLKLYLLWLNGYSTGLAVWCTEGADAPSQAGQAAHEKVVSELTASVGEVSQLPAESQERDQLTTEEWNKGMGCPEHRQMRSGSCHECAMLQPYPEVVLISNDHNCERTLNKEFANHSQAPDGTIWKCTCGLIYVHICDEAEGCSWALARKQV